jgi:hypothetical protein
MYEIFVNLAFFCYKPNICLLTTQRLISKRFRQVTNTVLLQYILKSPKHWSEYYYVGK